ncbi:MAG: peptidoglycan-binding domain-containing protein [Nitrospinota bacterium]
MRHQTRKRMSLIVTLAFAAALAAPAWAQEQPKPAPPAAAEKPAPAKKAPAKAAEKKAGAPEVMALQAALKKAGEDPGPADGKMGRKTRAALRTFQKKNGLKVSGQADKLTMAKLQPFMGN